MAKLKEGLPPTSGGPGPKKSKAKRAKEKRSPNKITGESAAWTLTGGRYPLKTKMDVEQMRKDSTLSPPTSMKMTPEQRKKMDAEVAAMLKRPVRRKK